MEKLTLAEAWNEVCSSELAMDGKAFESVLDSLAAASRAFVVPDTDELKKVFSVLSKDVDLECLGVFCFTDGSMLMAGKIGELVGGRTTTNQELCDAFIDYHDKYLAQKNN